MSFFFKIPFGFGKGGFAVWGGVMFLFKLGAPFSLIIDAFLSADISVRPKSHWKVLVVQLCLSWYES